MRAPIGSWLWVWLMASVAGCGSSPVESDDPAVTVGPVLELSRDEIDFGERVIQRQGTPVEVVLYNRGDEPLDVYVIRSLSSEKGFTVRSVGDGFRIRPGSESTFVASFRPESVGPAVGMILIETNVSQGDGAIRMAVRGVGVAGDLVVEPSALEVRDGPATVTLANDGLAPLRVTTVTTTGDPGFVVDLRTGTNGDLPFEIDPRDPETGRPIRWIEVRYDEATGDGTRAGELVFTVEDGAQDRITVPLSFIPPG